MTTPIHPEDGITDRVTSIDVTAVRPKSFNLPLLQDLIQQLLGVPFLFLRIGYGGELQIHLGKSVPYTNPRMKGRVKGSFILRTRASAWTIHAAEERRLFSSPRGVSYRDAIGETVEPTESIDLLTLEKTRTIQPGAAVLRVECSGHQPGVAVQIRFSDESLVYILPLPESYTHGDGPPEATATLPTIADWELTTPHGRVLQVGPEHQWSYEDVASKPTA